MNSLLHQQCDHASSSNGFGGPSQHIDTTCAGNLSAGTVEEQFLENETYET